MALTDINFQEGEGQDFVVEIPAGSYSGSVTDIAVESSGSQFLLLEVPQQGGRIFVISE